MTWMVWSCFSSRWRSKSISGTLLNLGYLLLMSYALLLEMTVSCSLTGRCASELTQQRPFHLTTGFQQQWEGIEITGILWLFGGFSVSLSMGRMDGFSFCSNTLILCGFKSSQITRILLRAVSGNFKSLQEMDNTRFVFCINLPSPLDSSLC